MNYKWKNGWGRKSEKKDKSLCRGEENRWVFSFDLKRREWRGMPNFISYLWRPLLMMVLELEVLGVVDFFKLVFFSQSWHSIVLCLHFTLLIAHCQRLPPPTVSKLDTQRNRIQNFRVIRNWFLVVVKMLWGLSLLSLSVLVFICFLFF